MKHWKLRLSAAALSAAMLLSGVPAAFASVALGSEVTNEETGLAPGTSLVTNRLWSATYSDLRTEHYISFQPSAEVTPVVHFGNYVISKQKLSAMASSLSGQGQRVIGGVNGGFYNVSAGTPIGLVIKDGELCSSASFQYAIGFRADGTAIVGQPVTNITATFHGETLAVSGGLNKTRTAAGGIFLISDCYAADTQNTADGVDVVLTPVDGQRPMLGTSIRCTVDEVRRSTVSKTLPAGKLILTMNAEGDAATLAKLESLLAGEEVVLDFTSSDTAWNDVITGIGSSYRLVSGGVALTGLPTGAAPRTAIGVKADGGVVLYTIDGRQSGYSVGASYTQVAQRLIELGCTEAVALDGGGSTTLGASLPGSSTFSLQNRPSDSAERSVSNGILLTFAVAEATGVLDHFEVGPGGTVLLSGAQLAMKATAVDTAYRTMPYDGALEWKVDGKGMVNEDGIYMAGEAGADTVTVTSGGKSGNVSVVVAATPDSITVQRENTAAPLSTITLQAGETVDLSAAAKWRGVNMVASDNNFTWSVDSAVGTVDGNGVLTAGQNTASGTLTVTAGGKSASVNVAVRGLPFDDVATGVWYYDAVRYVYDSELFNGVTPTTFQPDAPMSRAMLCTVLWRMAGKPEPVLSTTGSQTDEDGTPTGVIEVEFSDVPDGAYYAKAVKWASQQGLVKGMTATTFQPDTPISRQQIATLLCSYAEKIEGKSVVVLAGAPQVSSFADGDKVAEWARDGMAWAVGNGLMNGMDGGKLNPDNATTRCQVAALLMRYGSLS